MNASVDPLLLTVKDAAQRLGVSRAGFYKLLAEGEIESVTIGRSRKVPVDALHAYVERLRAGAAQR